MDPEAIMILSLGAIWNFSKGTRLPWVDIRLWATKGTSIRPRCIGIVRAWTQCQSFNQSTLLFKILIQLAQIWNCFPSHYWVCLLHAGRCTCLHGTDLLFQLIGCVNKVCLIFGICFILLCNAQFCEPEDHSSKYHYHKHLKSHTVNMISVSLILHLMCLKKTSWYFDCLVHWKTKRQFTTRSPM